MKPELKITLGRLEDLAIESRVDGDKVIYTATALYRRELVAFRRPTPLRDADDVVIVPTSPS